ncbi:MAG TPA: PAS domain S-box protein [Bacteriovoracaceae bacterium]|nr:PAS domain S-box protein [Bacteriovoracaceae bacterium]
MEKEIAFTNNKNHHSQNSNQIKQNKIEHNPKVIAKQMGSLEKSRLMATVIQDSNDAITFQDLDGNILAWNQGAEQIYGYSEAEALRMNIVDTVPTEYQEEARQFLSSLKRGELVLSLETKRKHKDGRIIDVWLTNTKLTDDKGNLTGVATTERDISERMGALEKFRRMATVIQDSNDAITFQDLEGNILAWNRGAETMYGYSEAEALRINIVDTVPKEYQNEARGFLAALKREELLPNLETKRKHKDGHIIDVWLINTKLTDEKGKLTGIATTERDITEMKQSEASLREKFRELDYLREGQIALSEKMRGEQVISRLGQSILSHLVPFTNAQVGTFYLVTGDKKLQMVSSHALSETEASDKFIEFGQGLIGQVAIEKQSLLIQDVPSSYFSKIESSLGVLIPRSLLICPILYENEVTGVIELASLHPFTEHQRAFLSQVSENIGIAINTSDVRKKVQKQNEILNKAQEDLEHAVIVRDEFMSIASHELKTPLTSMMLQVQMRKHKLKKDDASAFTMEKLTKMMDADEQQFKRLVHLIDDILDNSRITSGKLSMNMARFDLCTLVQEVVERFCDQAVGGDSKIQIDRCESTMGIWDRFRIEQVVTNLITNALRYGAGKPIWIQVSVAGDKAKLIVRDEGLGIAEENQERIFQRFERAASGSEVSGLGLGLYIVRQILDAHKGSIQVKSKLGEGSTFIVELPLDVP